MALLFRRELIRALREYELTPEQWQIMVALWQKTSLTQKQITELTLQDAPTASRTVARMQKKGFVKKTASASDKRATIISLTTLGTRLQGTIPPILLKHFRQILDAVSVQDQQTLLRILKEFRVVLGDPL